MARMSSCGRARSGARRRSRGAGSCSCSRLRSPAAASCRTRRRARPCRRGHRPPGSRPCARRRAAARAARRDAERADRDHAPLARMPEQGLGLAAPAQGIPHGRGRSQHRAGGVDGVAAALEHHRAGGRGQRLAGDGHPGLGVQRRFLGAFLGCRWCCNDGGGQQQHQQGARSRGPEWVHEPDQ